MFAARGGFTYVEAGTPPPSFPAWPAIPTQEEMNTEFSSNFVSSGNATAVASNFSIIASAAIPKRRHAVAHPNGNIYLLPRSNSQMLIYNTSANTMTAYNTTFTDYQGGALSGYNGNIYMMPHESSTKRTILEINTAPSVREISGLTNIPAAGSCDYQSAVSLGNSIMFFNFSTSANCLIYDPQANTLTVTPVKATTNNEFISGVYHPNGKVYIPPYDGNQMIEYDPANNTVRRFTMTGVTVTGADQYSGGTLGADNKIYFPPWGRSDILIYDPIANVAKQQTWGLSLGNYNFISGALGADGNVYVAPAPYGVSTANLVMVICTQPSNPSYNTAVLTNFGITAPAVGQWGIRAGANNKLVSVDETSGSVWVITTNGSANVNALLSPYLNKGG